VSSDIHPFLVRLREKVLVADGAMGTTIQSYDLSAEDFHGLDGCNEYLVVSRPDVIRDIHRSFLDAGADILLTNSFGSAALVLAEYDIGDRARELSRLSAQIAREAADSYSVGSWPRFVAGSVGPTTKLPTLGHISFDDLYATYTPQMYGLIEGGCDYLQIETCQDVLQLKCAVICARDVMMRLNRHIPICVTVTVEQTGTMLIGTEINAALVILESLPIDIIGMNCATGPDLMQENIRFLCSQSSRPVAVLPNAGLPSNVGGKAHYHLTPESLADYLEIFVKDFGAAMVGGCCGTTPAHVRALFERVGSLVPKQRKIVVEAAVASTYSAVPLDQPGSSPLIVGERCNSNGSKLFRENLLKEDWDHLVEMARTEASEGAHVLDVCTAYVGRDEVRDMREVVSRLVGQVTAPLMIDTTQLDVLESTLKLIGGRSIINSINLEDGEEKFDQICALAKRFGAALVALTIDEAGMAKTADKKLEIAQRIYDLCVNRHGLTAAHLIFDPLTFTIASGDEDSRRAAIETLDGIRLIKEHLPGCRTILGLSNVSFGLKPHARQLLNSVFLSEALKVGLDSAILHQSKILPLNKIPADLLSVLLDLIFDRRKPDYDPLFTMIEKLQSTVGPEKSANPDEGLAVEDALKKRIIDGRKNGIEQLLDEALKTYPALEIINTILLDGMKTVGELFGSGEMQLPFVLQSAETMKRAVALLEPHMDKAGGPSKGCMVIATVKGDVHDIGKNLVDIILSNNGYKVINLGIKQPLENILTAADEHKADVIGMSGLLVKSTLIMKENLEEMSRRHLTLPVICGGAALNRAYVEVDLRQAYKTGSVFYGADAFSGLHIMDELTGRSENKIYTAEADPTVTRHGEMRAEREQRTAEKSREYIDTGLARAEQIPTPPFWGVRYIETADIKLSELFTFINKKALYANQWMYRRGKRSTVEYKEFLREHVDPLFHTWCRRAEERKWIAPRVAYGYFPCNSHQNELIVFDPDDHDKEACRISLPRQIADARRCIADFFLPISAGRRDIVAFHAVTSGAIASEVCQTLFKADEYTDYLHFYGLSVETAEALAEFWHKRIRAELGINGKDGLTIDSLFHQAYQGERYSFGYPACPNLEDQVHIFKLLRPEEIGLSLSAEFQLVPEQSTTAIIVHHPEAGYFSI
jgi:5-methyltetrahydrofolate--homocysteine methyltransferase